MPSNYPGALDALTNPITTDPLTAPSHAGQHADANDAIEAIQGELGTDPAGAAATVKARLDALPLGVLGYAQVVTGQGSITTEVDLTNLTVTVTAGSSRRIRITAEGGFSSTVADDRAGLEIKESTTYLRQASMFAQTTNSGIFTSVIITPSSGSHTYKLAAVRRAGTGTLTFNAGATTPAYILVEDIGAA